MKIEDVDGMTLRDYFAGLALQAWLPRVDPLTDDSEAFEHLDASVSVMVREAYYVADAMLEARKQ